MLPLILSTAIKRKKRPDRFLYRAGKAEFTCLNFLTNLGGKCAFGDNSTGAAINA